MKGEAGGGGAFYPPQHYFLHKFGDRCRTITRFAKNLIENEVLRTKKYFDPEIRDICLWQKPITRSIDLWHAN